MISYTDCKSGTTKTSFKQTAMPEQQEKTGLKRAAAFGKRAYFWGILLAVTLAVLALAPFVCLLCLALPCKMKISLRNYIWLYGRSLTALWRPVMPVTINYADGAEDRFRALSGKGCILAFNHQSFLDSYLVSAQPLRNTCFLIKTWPFRKLFFFYPLMVWAKYVDTEKNSYQHIAERCHEEAQDGTAIVVFPEGRRTRTGELQRFHSGIFSIACAENIPVVPVVLHNSGKVCPAGKLKFYPGPVHISILQPVQPVIFKDNLLPHKAMSRHVRRLMQECLENAHTLSNTPQNGETQ